MDNQLKVSQLDPDQIQKRVFDDAQHAYRVILLNPNDISMPGPMNIIEGTERPEPLNLPQVRIERIEVPVIVKEVQIERIEVPVIVKEIEIREIQIPVIVKEIETKIERIEVPVFINRDSQPITITKQSGLNKWLFAICGLQTLLLIAMILKYTIL